MLIFLGGKKWQMLDIHIYILQYISFFVEILGVAVHQHNAVVATVQYWYLWYKDLCAVCIAEQCHHQNTAISSTRTTPYLCSPWCLGHCREVVPTLDDICTLQRSRQVTNLLSVHA